MELDWKYPGVYCAFVPLYILVDTDEVDRILLVAWILYHVSIDSTYRRPGGREQQACREHS